MVSDNMRIRCRRNTTVGQTLSFQAKRTPLRTEYDLVVGQEYVAMGLSVADAVVWIDIATEGGFLIPVPINEFEITSGRPCSLWEARVDEEGIFRLWPPSFYAPFYHSDLADREPRVVADFDRVRQQIEEEDRYGGLRMT